MPYGSYRTPPLTDGRLAQPRIPVPTLPAQPEPQPTNTRAQALQNVQQAFAQPSRLPGDTGFLNTFLQQSAQPATAGDPQLSGAIQAGRVADQRTLAQQRSALAERLGAQGLGDSGALGQKSAALAQQIGERGALRESGLVLDESMARRQALLAALGLDQSRYGVDTSAGLQLAQLEALLNQNAVQPFF